MTRGVSLHRGTVKPLVYGGASNEQAERVNRLNAWAVALDSHPNAKKLSGLRSDLRMLALPDLREQQSEIERLQGLCRDAYAIIDVLANGVGKITTPDGFFDLWNKTGIALERVGGKPFKARAAMIAEEREKS